MSRTKKASGTCDNSCRLGTVGGEAVLEGIMMKGKNHYAVAVRREDGTVCLSKHPCTSLRNRSRFFRLPIIRGVIGFVESMALNFKVLSMSAEQYGISDIEPESKFEKWIDKHFGDHLMDIIMTISTVIGVALALGLFLYLPAQIVKWIESLFHISLRGWRSPIEGVIKIAIFIGYLLLVSLMKDIRRTFEYHGAEHKSIFCYESGEELTVANVKKQRRFHPRCGTSFLFVILIISILINSLPFVPWDNLLLRVLTKLLLLPIIVGLGFEFIIYAGKHENRLTKILSAPGLWMQRITTREPDEGEIEVAIIALKTALPDVFTDYKYIDPHSIKDTENDSSSENSAKESDETADRQNPPSEADPVIAQNHDDENGKSASVS